MPRFTIDLTYLIISAVVSGVVSIAIAIMVNSMEPGLIKGGTVLFIFIGVFSANLIIEVSRQRLDKHRRSRS